MSEILSMLQGKSVDAICFVHNYIEIIIDGNVLRVFVKATLCKNGVSSASRDALCSVIGLDVEAVTIGASIELSLCGGARLIIPLSDAASSGPEMAQFVPRSADGTYDLEHMYTW